MLQDFLTFGVVPVLIGPLQALAAMLPALLVALGGALVGLFRPRTMRSLLRLLWHQKIFMTCLVAFVAVLWHARGLILRGGSAMAAAEERGATWSLMRGNPRRTGTQGGDKDPVDGGVNWAFTRDTRTFHASPAVVGNRVYVPSVADIGPFRKVGRGAIYCLDADSGAVVWKSVPPGYRATYSSPAVFGRYLVCGEGLHLVRDARIVCLDVEDRGRVLWEHRTRSHVESSPCIFEGSDGKAKVCIGAGDDGYYCLALEPGADGRARVIWHTGSEGFPDAETSPVVVAMDRVTATGDKETRLGMFAGLGVGGRAVICLDAETGEELWRQTTPYPVFSAPAVTRHNGRLVVLAGMGNGNVIETAEDAARKEIDKLRKSGATEEQMEEEKARLRPGGAVWCLSAADGEVLWRLPLPRTVLGAVVAAKEGVYFGCRDGRLYSAPYDGRAAGVRSYDTHEPISTSPALGRDHVYVITANGRLYGIGRQDLTPAWEMRAGLTGMFLSSPAVARGHLYVGTESYGLLCLGEEGRSGPPAWQGFMGGPGRPGHTEPGPLPLRAAFAWQYPATEMESLPRLPVVCAPAAHAENRLFVPVASGPEAGLVCLRTDREADVRDVEPAWSYGVPAGIHHSAVVQPQSPEILRDGLVFVVEGKPGDSGRHLACLTAGSGDIVWRKPLPDDSGGDLVLHGGQLFLEERPGLLVCRDLDGSVEWELETGELSGPVFLCDSLMVAATRRPARLRVFDWPTRKELWCAALEGMPVTGPVVDGLRVYLGEESGVSAFSLIDGSRVGHAETGTPRGRLTVGDPRLLAYVNTGRQLVVLDLDAIDNSGLAMTSGEPANPDVPPVICREGILFRGEKDLMLFDTGKRSAEKWMSAGWLGEPTSPMILAKSRAYFGAAGRGLVCAVGRE